MVSQVVSIYYTSVLASILLSSRNHISTGVNGYYGLGSLLDIKSQYTISSSQVQDVFVRLRIQELKDGSTQGWDKGRVLDVLLGGPLVISIGRSCDGRSGILMAHCWFFLNG